MTQDTPGCRVLLVEDEAMIAMLVEDMLEDLGHFPRTNRNGLLRRLSEC